MRCPSLLVRKILVLALCMLAPPSFLPPAGAESAPSLRRSATVLIGDEQGQALGSGVLVAASGDGIWVATNRHVVQEFRRLCVTHANGSVDAAMVMPPRRPPRLRGWDLALLWFRADSSSLPPMAQLSEAAAPVAELPMIVSTGYPVPLGERAVTPSYEEAEGLLLPLLREPLEGGFDLTYTAVVRKGMSGGGVFLDGRLIGINGAHAAPLWSGQWLRSDGQPVEPSLNRRLELVSLGLSADLIRQTLRMTDPPAAQDQESLAAVPCRPAAAVAAPSAGPISPGSLAPSGW